MTGLVACPFCRQMFTPGEERSCPECGLRLEAISKLPPSYDQKLEYPEEPVPPHMEELSWTYWGRGRGVLVALSLAGLAAFFAPWLHQTAPEILDLSGWSFAQRLGWLWAAGVAPFVLLPLVLTRRSIFKMRGSRLAVGLLGITMLTTVVLRLVRVPASTVLRPVRFEWGWGLYASGVVALLIIAAGALFGGRLDDVPTKAPRRGDETLH